MANRTITIDVVVNDQGAVEKLTQLDTVTRQTTAATIPATQASNEHAAAQKNMASATAGAAAAKGELVGMLKTYLTAAAIAGAIKSTIDQADALQKMSEQTGIGTTRLQALSTVANENGTTMHGLATAISALSDRIAGGDKSAVAAADRLGLSIDALRKMTPDELFITVAEALGRMPDPLERTTTRVDLMGRTANEVAGLMKTNIRAMIDDQERLGNVMDTQTIKALNDLRNSVRELTTAGQNLIAAVLGPMAPLLSAIAQAGALAARGIAAAAAAARAAGGSGAEIFDPSSAMTHAMSGGAAMATDYLVGSSPLPTLPPAPAMPMPQPYQAPPMPATPQVMPFAKGGRVDRPTLAMLGEGGEPEWVIPESKMGGTTVIVNAQGAHFENEAALQRLADKVAASIGARFGQGVRV